MSVVPVESILNVVIGSLLLAGVSVVLSGDVSLILDVTSRNMSLILVLHRAIAWAL